MDFIKKAGFWQWINLYKAEAEKIVKSPVTAITCLHAGHYMIFLYIFYIYLNLYFN